MATIPIVVVAKLVGSLQMYRQQTRITQIMAGESKKLFNRYLHIKHVMTFTTTAFENDRAGIVLI